MLKLIAAAVIGAAVLTACGGNYKPPAAVVVAQPDYKQTDTLIGTGATAKLGTTVTIYDPDDAADKSIPDSQKNILNRYMIDSQLVTVNYTGYLYDSTKPDGKGAVVETSAPGESMFPGFPMQPFTLGAGKPLANTTALIGFDQAVVGMQVGGKRTVVLPASLAYGATAIAARTATGNPQKSFPAVPANSPLVYDIELVAVTMLPNIIPATPPAVVTDLVAPVVGTGAAPVAGKYARVYYTGYFYDGTVASRIGKQFDTNVPVTAPTPPAVAPTLSFLVDASPLEVIKGFNDAVKGMQVGGKRTVIIPSKFAYGKTGSATIPADSTLVFTIELVSVGDTKN
ncbi:FKBP-type peptidyl-prolyl cis-trans isomerase [Duganella sp. Leaf126]|uniref:FKBP-type peptidyl-prolyl cis-trans isomerase n=1 Tax=Duganella sp. Leaf126 TaxID=1736266 RepID=UPI00138F100B|nr:FKBP-type peptidyl-prolyl cis-trans isomerase [Duganella sp. Leaf126]